MSRARGNFGADVISVSFIYDHYLLIVYYVECEVVKFPLEDLLEGQQQVIAFYYLFISHYPAMQSSNFTIQVT